jgi:diguanylate cyclase
MTPSPSIQEVAPGRVAVIDPERDAFERLTRPLLELFEHLTGLESTFVTAIDWAAQRQRVLIARNTGELTVAEGSDVAWADTMCRWSFLTGTPHTADVPTDYPGSVGAEELGMQSFLALPIQAGDVVLGTVCGASRDAVELEPGVLSSLELISASLAFQLGALVERDDLRRRAEGAEALAMVDPLTGVANLRGFEARFEEELARAGRHGSPVALLALDIDHFKVVNDTHGHLVGDRVLVALGDVLRRTARLEDVPARLGGDELVLLLTPGDAASAEIVARRVAAEFRTACEAMQLPCTVSIGWSSSDSTSLLELRSAADDALYLAKAARP